jgi:acyl-CoA reductase-like NAD-dependent aldehyde dehydrogenase
VNKEFVPADLELGAQIQSLLAAARIAQSNWARESTAERLRLFRQLRRLMVRDSSRLAESSARLRGRYSAESFSAELLPLVDACRFLEREAARVLAPRRLGWRTRPLWLSGITTEIRREPVGMVLIIGPGNYPLLLPGVQALQALAAGNAVLIKPAPGCTEPMRLFVELLVESGFDPALVILLPQTIAAARTVLESGIDKVLFTGSAATGEKILAQLAPLLIPATMELSGSDAVLIRADADLDLAVRALAFGMRLNAGETCIAPRRIFVVRTVESEFEGRMASAFAPADSVALTAAVAARLLPLLKEALRAGAHLVAGQITNDGSIRAPIVLAGVTPELQLLREDIFSPVLCLVSVADDREAVARANDCPYALGASVFTRDEVAGKRLASEIKAGVVCLNDLIVPTADARVPFGGRGRSGFGVTRGAEGLLELTAPKVMTVSRSRFRPAFDAPRRGDELLFALYLRFIHLPGLVSRAQALVHLLWQLAGRRRTKIKS